MANDRLLSNVAVVGLAYLLIGKPILDFLGLSKGAGTKSFENETQNPNSCFLPNFWRNYYYQQGAPANKRKPLTNDMLKRMRVAANYFYNGFGVVSDDEGEIFKAINSCKSKSEVSLMSYFISTTYGGDMLSLMKYGRGNMPQNGLSENELNNIFKKVSSLPTI